MAADSASADARKAVRVHVMRQFHKKSREQAVGTDRRRDHSHSAVVPRDPSNEDNALAMTLGVSSSRSAAITQIEPFRFPIRVPHEDSPLIESNPAPAATGNGGYSIKLLDRASHNENSYARFRLTPSHPPNSIRLGPTPPLQDASQINSSSLKLVRFCQYPLSLLPISTSAGSTNDAYLQKSSRL